MTEEGYYLKMQWKKKEKKNAMKCQSSFMYRNYIFGDYYIIKNFYVFVIHPLFFCD